MSVGRYKKARRSFFGDFHFFFPGGGGRGGMECKKCKNNCRMSKKNDTQYLTRNTSILLCRYDVVELYDGVKEKNRLLGSYCDVQV